MARIYVSSTFSDLADYRKEVSLALRRLGHEDMAMEYYVAEDRRPLDRCLEDVASCEAYIGIFAWRYGYVPETENPDRRSITELEYRHALSADKTCLIFLISDEAPWPRAKMEFTAMARIEAFRQELMSNERHIVSEFGNADELARKVNEAVINWEKQTGKTGKREATDWYTYRQAVLGRHRWIRLQVIAGLSKERDPVRIPLTEVFEPQLVAPGVSGTDIPDEVRRYQQEIYGARSGVPEETALATEGKTEGNGGATAETEEQLLFGNPEQVLDILGRERAQVMLGGPGSGKSTLLQYAMLRVCDAGGGPAETLPQLRGEPIPFLVELRNYVLQQDPDFISHIVRRSNDFYGVALDADSINKILAEDGMALIFFDGLDEVFDPDERRRVIDQFQGFARRYPGARIVVTSRIAGYDRTGLGLAGFAHYTLMPLTLGHIRNFAEQWYRYYTLEGTERTAQGLVQRIVESPRLLDLAGNPLLLTMMAVIFKDRDLPNERWRLYERCAETLLEDWDLSKGIEDEDFKLAVAIRTAQKSEILQQVSMYMLDHSQPGSELNAIAYGPLQHIIAGYLEQKYQRPQGEAEAIAVDILRHLMERTYVLAGIGERVFGFVHRTFMEYFAACWCLAQFNALRSDFAWLNRDIFEAHWQMPEWEEVLLLLIAMLHDQGTPIRDVVEYLRLAADAELPFHVVFAARCLGEAGDVQDKTQGEELLAQLAEAIAEHASRSRRQGEQAFVETALRAFAALAPMVTAPRAVHDAIARLDKCDAVATRTAAWQMGFAMRSRRDRLDYALAALHDTQEAVRRGAITALEREWPGRTDIGPVLVEVVKNDRQSRVRLAALAAIQRSWRHEPAILDAIDERADDEAAFTVVIRLIEYLAGTWRKNPRAFELIMKLAAPKPRARYDYNYAEVLDAGARAIAQGWGGDAQGLVSLTDRAGSDPEPSARGMQLEALALGWAGDAQVLAFLTDRASNDPDPSTRATVLQAVARSWAGDAQALAFLTDRASSDPEPFVRGMLLQALALGWADDARVLAFLTDRAGNDPDPSTRGKVLEALADRWAGHSQALPFLTDRASNDPDPSTRAKVLQALAEDWAGHAQILPFLTDRASNDPDPSTRGMLLQVLAYRWAYDTQVLPFLTDRASNDPDPSTRGKVLEALAEDWAGHAQILPFLTDRASNDPDPSTRATVLQALGYFGRRVPQVLAFLTERASNDPDPFVRGAAWDAAVVMRTELY